MEYSIDDRLEEFKKYLMLKNYSAKTIKNYSATQIFTLHKYILRSHILNLKTLKVLLCKIQTQQKSISHRIDF